MYEQKRKPRPPVRRAPHQRLARELRARLLEIRACEMPSCVARCHLVRRLARRPRHARDRCRCIARVRARRVRIEIRIMIPELAIPLLLFVTIMYAIVGYARVN